jgi:hypothetical protein
MRFAACAATSHEIAATLGGDDIVVRARGDLIDASRPLADVAVVRSGFEAFAKGDVAGFAQMFHADATWQHRNDDRPGGVHRGTDGIMSFLAESGQLTGGTLRAVPQAFMADGADASPCSSRSAAGARTAARSTSRRSCSSASAATACAPSTSTSETRRPWRRSGRSACQSEERTRIFTWRSLWSTSSLKPSSTTSDSATRSVMMPSVWMRPSWSIAIVSAKSCGR